MVPPLGPPAAENAARQTSVAFVPAVGNAVWPCCVFQGRRAKAAISAGSAEMIARSKDRGRHPKPHATGSAAESRQFWKGYLRLSLVTCPVAMSPATSETEKVRFHTLSRQTGDRVVSQYVDAVTGKPVEEGDQARAYARGENDYVLLEDEELEAAALESVHTIDIANFTPIDAIDWIWWESAYYLTPDDPVGVEAYCVIRDAMRAERMAAISRLVLGRRERAVMLRARGDGIVLWTLRYGDEVRDASEAFDRVAADPKPDPELRRLVAQMIEERKKSWSPEMVQDPVQSRLLEIIEEKKKGVRRRSREKVEDEPAPSNVVSIVDALRRSIAAGRNGGKRPRS
jgi:DNA end-binding protein Ku